MPVPEQTPVATFTGNGVTTDFSFAWGASAAAHVVVEVDEVELTQGVDYTVLSIGDGGGTVRITPAPALDAAIAVFRRTPLARVDIDYQEAGPFLAETVDLDFNTLWRAVQEFGYTFRLVPQLPIGSPLAGTVRFPPPGAGYFLRWNAAGDGLEAVDVETAASVSTLKPDLADGANPAAGDALVAVKRITAGSVARTLHGWIQTQPLEPEDFGAVGDGITDDTAALTAWAASAVARRKRFGRAYLCKSAIVFNPGDHVEGDGPGATLDFSSATIAAGGACVSCSGTLTPRGATLAAAVGAGQVSFDLLDVSGLSVGDVLVLYDPTNYSWSGWRAEYRAGEFVRIGRIVGNKIYTLMPLYDGYPDTVQVYKLSGAGAKFSNFRIRQPGGSNVGLQLSYLVGPIVEDVNTGGSEYAGIEFKVCYDIHLRGSPFQSSPSTDDEYGVVISNCHGGEIVGSAWGGRHPVAFGGGDYPCCVPCRALRVYGAQHGNLGPAGAGDLHGNTEDIMFFGVTFSNGGDVGGANHKFIGCRFLANQNSGIALYQGEPVKGIYEFVNCTFDGKVDPAPNYALVHLGNLSNKVKDTLHYRFDGCTFLVTNASPFAIVISVNGSLWPANIAINGATLRAGASFIQFLRLEHDSGLAALDYVSIKNLAGLPSGAAFAAVSGMTVNKWALPAQSGTKVVGIGSVASAYSNTVVFPNPYPVTPRVTASKTAATVGGDRALIDVEAPHVGGCTVAVSTCDGGTFAAADSATVMWHATLDG